MESIQSNFNPLNLQYGLGDVIVSDDKFNIIEIDLIDRCQLKCPLCLRQEFQSRKKIYNPNDVNDLILFFNNLFNIPGYNIKLVKLIGTLSEPTLYKDLIKLILFFNSKDISVQISTNGNLENDLFWYELKHALNNNPQNELLFAIEGSTEESYQRYRQNGRLSKVLHNLNIISIERKFKLGWQFIKFQHNENEFNNIKKLINEKIDFIEIYHCNEPENLNQEILPTKEIISKFYKKRMLINDSITNLNFDMKNIICKSETFKELFIDVHRNVWPCTNLFEYYLQMGTKPDYIPTIYDFIKEDSHYKIKEIYKNRSTTFECFKSCSNYGHKLEKDFLRKRIINDSNR